MTLSEFAIELPALRDEAKAKWGEHQIINVYRKFYKCTKCGDSYIPYEIKMLANSCWEHYLMLIIKSDNPVKYLKENNGK